MEIKIKISLATKEDFSFDEDGIKKRKIGMVYFLKNSSDQIECYEIGDHTNPFELAQFIKEERCFVIRERGSLATI